MTEKNNTPLPLPPARRASTHLFWLLVVFTCGAIIGAVGGSLLTRQRMLAIMRNPEQIPDRIMAQIRSELALDEQQATQIQKIVRQRYANMELLRADVYSSQRDEFTAMYNDVALLLNDAQKIAWTELCQTVEQRYLPRKPSGPPIDLIVFRFDANDDNILSEDEIPPRMWLRLSKADENGDGSITRDEFVNTAAKNASQ
jgi:hypothetical protein